MVGMGLSQLLILWSMHKGRKNPFSFGTLPFLPHTPHNPPERLLKKYQQESRPLDQAKYYAMCEWLDDTVGELIGYLDDQGLKENTLVVFTCDNGWSNASSNVKDPNQKLFRSYAQRSKGSPYEGGTRNPILLSWPKRITPADSPDLAHAVDLMPTIVRAAGGKVPQDYPGLICLMSPHASKGTRFSELIIPPIT